MHARGKGYELRNVEMVGGFLLINVTFPEERGEVNAWKH